MHQTDPGRDEAALIVGTALALTMLTWATWEWVVPAASADVESLFYLAWSLPLTGLLAWKLYAPALAMPALSRGGRASVWSTTQ